MLRGLGQKGLSIIYISSELEEILQVSDRILVMHEGQSKGWSGTSNGDPGSFTGPGDVLALSYVANLMSKASAIKEETPIKRDSPLKQALRWEASGVLIALIVLCLALSLVSPNFLNTYNLTVVIRQASFVGLVALGQTLVLLLGGIDLSLGACASFSAIVGSLMLKSAGVHPWLVIPLTALFGLASVW